MWKDEDGKEWPDYEEVVHSYLSYGYEGDGWIVLRHLPTGTLVEMSGSHCSCNGLEYGNPDDFPELTLESLDKSIEQERRFPHPSDGDGSRLEDMIMVRKLLDSKDNAKQ